MLTKPRVHIRVMTLEYRLLMNWTQALGEHLTHYLVTINVMVNIEAWACV